MKHPTVVYVTIDQDCLLAWNELQSVDDGKVGVYVLKEVLDKRTVVEIQRKGAKVWFRHGDGGWIKP